MNFIGDINLTLLPIPIINRINVQWPPQVYCHTDDASAAAIHNTTTHSVATQRNYHPVDDCQLMLHYACARREPQMQQGSRTSLKQHIDISLVAHE